MSLLAISQSIYTAGSQQPALASLVAVSIILCVHHLIKTRAPRNAPPVIGGLPFIGIALSLVDPHKFLSGAQKKYGDIFSVLFFGIKAHIVLDPIRGIPAVLRNSSTLSFRETERWIDDCFFDYPASMTEDDDFEFKALDKMVKPHLVGSAGMAEMSEAYLTSLRGLLDHEVKSFSTRTGGDGWVDMDDLFKWSRRLLFQASNVALFGPEFPMDCCEDYWSFEENLFKFLTLPQFLISSAIRSRNRLVSRVAATVAKYGGLPKASKLVQERISLTQSFGYTTESIAKTELDMMFALQANATPTAFWVLLHIITDPSLSLKFRKIADDTAMSNDELLKTAKMPELDGVFKEALRMHSHAPIIRKVMAQTVIPIANDHVEGGIEEMIVEPGSYVVIPTPTVHFSELNYPDPDVFDPSRWDAQPLEKCEKTNSRSTNIKMARQQLVSFGGGSHYCPGRFFARIEIMSFAILFYKLFEVQNPERVKMASGWRFGTYAQGTQLPATKTPIRLRPRSVVRGD